ncbi:RNA-directed DNA polymerase (Reverse transcriptase), partial [Trifolium medium]|nr:RNA-directed DNA polymerase (Reverse transcriptase) [Trifolium medium]
AIFASKGVPESEKSKILAISDVKFTSNLDRYLGFRMFHGRITQREFSDVMDSIQSKLTSWKGRLLNTSGRNEGVRWEWFTRGELEMNDEAQEEWRPCCESGEAPKYCPLRQDGVGVP